MSIAITLHLLAAIIWIGGMFFAYMVLRPCAAQLLPPPQRITLWHGCFKQFFPWVWGSIIVLAGTGYGMALMLFGGISGSGWHIKVMGFNGLLMITLFVYLYLHPYAQFKRLVDKEDYPEAGQALATIRAVIGTNLIIGLLTTITAAMGRTS